MENRDYYTVKEVMFGLREEYRTMEKELQTLTNFCICDKRLVSGYRFDLSRGYGEKANIICRYKKKENLIQKFLRKNNPMNDYFELSNINTIVCTKDNNDRYFISKGDDWNCFPKYSVAIREDKNKDFAEQTSKILNSNFIFNMNDSVEFNSDNNECTLRTTLDDVDFIVNMSDDGVDIIHFNYYAGADLFTVRFFSDRKSSTEMIESVLDMKIPKEKLSPYHIGLIDENQISEKKIVLEKIKKHDYVVEFDIKEDSDQIVLAKSKRK